MALKFTNTGKGTLGDIISGWNVSEYATPFVPGDSSSSTNSSAFSGGYTAESIYLTDKSVTITHVPEQPEQTSLGSITGRIQSNSLQGAVVGISQSSVATNLNVDKVASALVPGRYIGGRYIAAGAKTFPNGGIAGKTISADGRYVYILAYDQQANASIYWTCLDLNTNKIVFTGKVGSGFGPFNVKEKQVFALQDGTGRIGFTNAGVSGPGSIGFGIYDGKTGRISGSFSVNVAANIDNNNSLSSATPEGDILAIQYEWNRPTNTTATASNRLLKVSSSGTVLVDTGVKQIAATTDDGTPVSSAVYVLPSQAVALSDDRFIGYGPFVAGQSRYQAWAIYSYTAAGIKLISDITYTGDGTYRPTNQDKYGNFVIGRTLFDTDGNQVFNFTDQASVYINKFNNSVGSAMWTAIGMTQEGNVTIASTNYDYPLKVNPWSDVVGFPLRQQSGIRFDQFDTSVSLSDVFSYYFSLVKSNIFTYRVDYQATVDPIVTLAGWNGNVWDHICQLCVAFRVELVFVNNVPTVRDIGSTEIDVTETAISPSLSPSAMGNSRTVSLSYQNATNVSTSAIPDRTLTNLSTNPTARANITGYANLANATVARSSGVVKAGQTSVLVRKLTGSTSSSPPWAIYGSNGTINTTGDRMIGMARSNSYHVRMNVWKPSKTSGSNTGQIGMFQVIQVNSAKKITTVTACKPVPNAKSDTAVSVDLSVRTDTTDMYIQFIGSLAADTHFYNIRITKKGLEAPGYLSDKYYDGNTRGWTWVGPANNSKSQMVFPGTGVPTTNVIYDAYAKDNQTFSVDVLGKETTTIDTGVYISTIRQPTASNNLGFTPGTYYVSASDNLPVTAAQWLAYGGKVEVAINKDDTKSLDITLTGPTSVIPGVAGPFSLSASDGENNYAIFSVIGTGVKVTEKILVLPTGVDTDKITQDSLGQVDNFAINTLEDAYNMGYILQDANGAATQELSFDLPIARLSGFGLTPGARFMFAGNMYRVSQVTIGNVTASITAVRYVTVDDVVNWYGDMPVENVAALWAGYTAHDTVMAPLKALG